MSNLELAMEETLIRIRKILPSEYDGVELDYAVVSYVLQLAVRAGDANESERLNSLKEEFSKLGNPFVAQ